MLRRVSLGALVALLACFAAPASAQSDSVAKQMLERWDNQVESTLQAKCFTKELALGPSYGDCAQALTLLNMIEPDAKKLNVLLLGTRLATALGFQRKADGTWDDRYTTMGRPVSATETMEGTRPPPGPNVRALIEKCVSMSACSDAELQKIVREADALRKDACGGADPCGEGNVKLMSFEEKMLIATGNRARAELAERAKAKPLADAKPGASVPARLTDANAGRCLDGPPDGWIAKCTALIESGTLAGEALAVAYKNRADAYYGEGRYAECIADTTKAIPLSPTLSAAALIRGRCQMEQGQLQAAIRDLDGVIRLKDNLTATAYLDRGTANYRLGLNDQALADYTAAIASDPNHALAYSYRAVVEQALGRDSQAIADVERAIGLAPNDPGIKRTRDDVYAKARQRTASAPPPAPAPARVPAPAPPPAATAANTINGIWKGDSSGNVVKIEPRTGGLFISPVTQNAGQSTNGMLYATGPNGTFRLDLGGGAYSVLQIIGPEQMRVTNPDGWTDIFRPDRSAAQAPRAPAVPPPASGCIGSTDYCYAIENGCTPGVCMAPPGWKGTGLILPRRKHPEPYRAEYDTAAKG